MLVYRVENRFTRKGPYVGLNVLEAMIKHSDFDTAPLPHEDGIPCESIQVTHRFGFQSIRDLFNWFHHPDMIKALIQDDYSISVYEVPDYEALVGMRQLVFDIGAAQFVEHIEFPHP